MAGFLVVAKERTEIAYTDIVFWNDYNVSTLSLYWQIINVTSLNLKRYTILEGEKNLIKNNARFWERNHCKSLKMNVIKVSPLFYANKRKKDS